MPTALAAPAFVSSLDVGTFFFVNIGGLTDLAVVYGSESDPAEPKGYTVLFDRRDGAQGRGFRTRFVPKASRRTAPKARFPNPAGAPSPRGSTTS